MTNTSETDNLKHENQKLRDYISLILAEIELTQRIREIRQNFASSSDSEHIITPISDRLSKIQSEKLLLKEDLNLS